ncbi:MAG: alanine racemase [Balneolaceae bacterium]|nr:alanine racemase [Balneolaceae bacterium]
MDFVRSPALILDPERCRANIAGMAERARSFGARLCPHMKTHQSAEIGRWMRAEGVEEITVSSVDMAAYFAEAGWEEITIAFPVNLREMERLNGLASRLSLSVLLSDPDALSVLQREMNTDLGVWLEVDSGSGRTGIPWDNTEKAGEVLDRLVAADRLHFRGFYSHPGHSYAARSAEEIREINRSCAGRLRSLRDELTAGEAVIRMGDTPCCSVGEDFEGIEEWSPGNFVFYDLMQEQIGACREQQIACALACPVVARHPQRLEVTVHGGAVHLSKDRLEENGGVHYGKVVRFDEDGWSASLEGCSVSRLSQEHGLLSLSREVFDSVRPGDLLGVLPVHSCLTADLMGGYLTPQGSAVDHLRGG